MVVTVHGGALLYDFCCKARAQRASVAGHSANKNLSSGLSLKLSITYSLPY